jgi:hypothetical protein
MIRMSWKTAKSRLALFGTRVGLLIATALLSSCGQQVRDGQTSSYLILTTLQGASGAKPDDLGTVVSSDVITVVANTPTFFADPGSATFQLALKDPGSSTSPNAPTPNNYITLTQYHVKYVRSDGHNTEGVDVPYAFDGALTATVSDTTTVAFTLVRNQAKSEAPLKALAVNPIVLTTIAEVTFYGHDQTGRQVSVKGNIEISFANFGDAASGG